MGEREFEYRLTTDVNTLDKDSGIFNQPLYALSFFPSGSGEKKELPVEIKNSSVILSRFKKDSDGELLLRLYNASELRQNSDIAVGNDVFNISFNPFEVKTYKMSGGKLIEKSMI